MPDITWDLKAQMGSLVEEMRKSAAAASASADQFDALDDSIKSLVKQVEALEKQNKELSTQQTKQAETDKLVTKGLKDKERAYARAAENEAKATLSAQRTALAQENMSKTLQRVAKAENLTFNSTVTLARVMDEYGEILREGGDNQGYLINQWKRSLTPAEKTAQKIAEIAAFSTDAERDTRSWTNSVTRNIQKLNEQQRRLEENGAAGGRYGMSLREMLQEQTRALSASDRFSGGLSGLAQTFASRVNPQLGAFIKGMGGVSPAALAAVGGVTAIGTAAAVAYKKAASAAADFEYAQTMLANKVGLAGDTSAQASAQIALLQKASIDAGLATKFSAVEATGGLQALVTMGFRVKDATEALRPTLDFATALNLDIATAAQTAAAAQNVFAHESTTLTERLNLLAKATTVSAIQQDDLLMALSKASRGAAVTGQSMQELLLVMAQAKDAGMTMEEAGTATSNALLKMATKAKDGKLSIAGMSIEVGDANGNFRDFGDILIDISEKTQHLGTVARTAALAETFGPRSIGPINAALSKFENGLRDANGTMLKGADALKELRKQFSTTGDEIGKQSEDLTNTVTGQLQILSGQWDTYWTMMGQKSEGVLSGTLKFATESFGKYLEYSRKQTEIAERAQRALNMAREDGRYGTLVYTKVLLELDKVQGDQYSAMGDVAGRFVEYNGVLYDTKTQAKELAQAQGKVTEATEGEGVSATAAASAMREYNKSLKERLRITNQIAEEDLTATMQIAEGESFANAQSPIESMQKAIDSFGQPVVVPVTFSMGGMGGDLFASMFDGSADVVQEFGGIAQELQAAVEESILEMEDTIGGSIDRITQQEIAAARAREAAIQSAIQSRTAAVTYGADLAQTALSTVSQAILAFGKDQEKAQRLAFLAEQAAAAKSVIINTAQAISKSIAMFGPPPASLPAILAVSAIGAAQLAIIGKGTISGLGGMSGGGSSGGYTSAAPTVSGEGGAVSSGETGDVYSGTTTKGSDYVAVSDAYFGASSGKRTIQMSAGDEAVVRRSGPMGSEGDAMEQVRLLKAIHSGISDLATAVTNLTAELTMSRSRAVAASPAGRF